MTLKNSILAGAVAAGALALAFGSAANAATTITVGTMPTSTSAAYFYLDPGSTPFTPSITASFGDTVSGSFDDAFDFTIPQNGTGSGSFSTSFSSVANQLNITDVVIDGTSYKSDIVASTGGYSLAVNGIPITDGTLNTIEIVGNTTGTGTFAGTATFTSAAPEPATWSLMIVGIGFMGTMLRRRRSAAVSFA